jgi:hypothetical protein
VRYELGFYIPEDDILHSHCRENFISYIALIGCALYGDILCLLCGTNLVFVSQETAFFIFTAVNNSNLTPLGQLITVARLVSQMPTDAVSLLFKLEKKGTSFRLSWRQLRLSHELEMAISAEAIAFPDVINEKTYK